MSKNYQFNEDLASLVVLFFTAFVLIFISVTRVFEFINEEVLIRGEEISVSGGYKYVCQPTPWTVKTLALEKELENLKKKDSK